MERGETIAAIFALPLAVFLVCLTYNCQPQKDMSKCIDANGFYIDAGKIDYISPMTSQDMDIAVGPYWSFTVVVNGAPVTIGDFNKGKIADAWETVRTAWRLR